jgi:hypothetical protein
MTATEFDKLLERRIECIRSTLKTKSAEYAPGNDRLHNFKIGARILDLTPAQVCLGFLTKHLVSVLDIIEAAAGGHALRLAYLDEKIGDLINYFVLLEAILTSAADPDAGSRSSNNSAGALPADKLSCSSKSAGTT